MTELELERDVVRCPSHGCEVAVDYFGRRIETCPGCEREAIAGELALRARIARDLIADIGRRPPT